jgi:uncharacterized membrane protein
MSSHYHIPDSVVGVISIILTFLVSVWTSIALEVVHGIITLLFALVTCAAVFYFQRYLKNKHK